MNGNVWRHKTYGGDVVWTSIDDCEGHGIISADDERAVWQMLHAVVGYIERYKGLVLVTIFPA